MKISYITKSLLNGGAETNICDLGEWFAARGAAVEVVVLSASSEANVARLRAARIHVVELHGRNALQSAARLWRHLRRSDADVVHAHMPLASQICRVLRIVSRFRLVTTEHNVWPRIHVLHRLVARLLRHADAASLACSAQVAASFPYPLQVNANGRNFRAFEQAGDAAWPLSEVAPGPASLIYLNVANVNAKKDHIHLLESFRRVPPEIGGRKTWLLIAGAPGDSWDEVRRFIAAHAMEDRVLLLGARPDVATLMRHADAFVLSSLHEGLPLVVLEAMYLGLPVVSTAVGELPELLRHTDWVVEGRSPDAFAHRMVSVMSDARTAQMVEHGKALAREVYSIERQAAELERLYSAVSGVPAGSHRHAV